MSNKYHLVVGMEVHAELKTASKMFCGCKNDPFHAEKPNIYTCPVCLGMPGGLPVANKKAIEWTIKLGLALNCKINLFSHFDRKNYFYPDLPKGYQISQYDVPFCYDGEITTPQGKVRIRRIHLEEDTGKLLHKTVDGKKVSLIDFNRGGVPLVELVTEPDIHTPEQAKAYTKSLRQILRFLDIADCDMEQGGMRLEANISLQNEQQLTAGELASYKVELKNINSFRFLEKAIGYEAVRQAEILDEGKIPVQETRGWDDVKGETFSQRVKEDAEDYRYFPDPDLPPIRFTQQQVEKLRASLPELPAQVIARWAKDYQVEEKYAVVLTEEKELADWADAVFAQAAKSQVSAAKIASALVNKKLKMDLQQSAAEVVSAYKATNQADEIDPAELAQAVATVVSANATAVENYKAGKTQVIGFFMGQVQRSLGKKADPQIVMAELKKQLAK
jgi:aspartyl-tRNA(Asn)/glutamyl-tRNA(Gln) amidotransferase subunit B